MANKKKQVKKVNKKVDKKIEEENDMKGLFKTIIIVLVSFAVCYLLFLLMGKAGMFEKGYEKPEGDSSEFTYNTALIGTVFNRPENEYYVAFDEEDGSKYFDSLLSLYKGSLQVYNVNMSLGINAKYKSEFGNPKAIRPSELKIAVPTLIKIKNGSIVKYLESIDDIESELSNN